MSPFCASKANISASELTTKTSLIASSGVWDSNSCPVASSIRASPYVVPPK